MSESEHEHEWKLAEPFDIDHGELDGISPQMCFCLGAEWWQVRTLLQSGECINHSIHAENASRLKRMLIRVGRKFRIGDATDGWCMMEVAGASGEFEGGPR